MRTTTRLQWGPLDEAVRREQFEGLLSKGGLPTYAEIKPYEVEADPLDF